MEWRNESIITEFILLGFGELQELQILIFLLFLIIYIMTMTENLLIIAIVVTDRHLHIPMYFFLGNLSFLAICYSTTIIPRILVSLLTDDQSVPVHGCIMQLSTFSFLAVTECYLLAAMSYDRYVAVCRPLHYSVLMNIRVYLQLMAGSWFTSLMINITLLSAILQLTFCGHNVIDHFFCDFAPMMKLTCSYSFGQQVKLLSTFTSSFSILPPFILTVGSYGCIIAAIFRISSSTGRQKAFSTCSSHLTVVTVFFGTLTVVYVLPDTNELRELNKVLSVFYTILTPLVNPLIYSLRNKDVHIALKKAASKWAVSI
ncbi:olfactory receptor 5V1-like [Varanus komodoensis]|uniref:olfactory receptor 5V1-like n=1 Tax=Varanus komodoensis TaxID=61221 RepID=UPI001CF77965|nr:olfactory receptor 5V1-like [Varanus komodoensis]